MLPIVLILLSLPLAEAPVPARFEQVSPAGIDERTIVRSLGQTRAIVLIHGFTQFDNPKLVEPPLHSWQWPDAHLVRSLSREADIFAFGYAQPVGLAEVVQGSRLVEQVRRLRDLGYSEIVLIGHSAGGLVARQIVEDHPDLPVRRVIQVATPNLGTGWANFQWPGSRQNRFLSDLTKWVRRHEQTSRAEVKLPAQVEFVCVLANGLILGDGIVNLVSQWPDDLARQGVPGYEVRSHHRGAVRDAEAVALLTNLATTPQRRWTEAEVIAARRRLLGK